jgi:hypothetical protein
MTVDAESSGHTQSTNVSGYGVYAQVPATIDSTTLSVS